MDHFRTHYRLLFAIMFFLLIPAVSVSAEGASYSDEWEFDGMLYLWGASVNGKASDGTSVKVDFNDLFNNLDMAFMGAFEARKGKWALTADVIYAGVSDEETIQGIPVSADLKNWVVTPFANYSLIKTQTASFDVLAGARYLNLNYKLVVGPYAKEDTVDVWDAIVGFRGRFNLSEKWYIPYHLDIGTGESDMTWQGLAGLGYKFSRFDVQGGYRYLKWDFDSDKVVDDMDISGPYLGIKWTF